MSAPPIFLGLAILLGCSLVVAVRPGVSPSRRALAAALALLVPGPGLFLAMMVRRIRGGAIAIEPELAPPSRGIPIADLTRMGEAPPVLDRLLTGDQAERLEALVGLSSAPDATTVAVLRWAIAHGPPDVVLEAALTLEEIELRGEASMAASREMLGSRDAGLALAAAEASAHLIAARIADPAIAPTFAEQARTYYQLARDWAPERADEIDERRARLELIAGQPHAALELADDLLARGAGDRDRIAQLRDDAAFAARQFDVLAFTPGPLELPIEVPARRLQTALS
jgi:hypothetical protein